MTIGRPTKLTPELTERIVARVVTGSSLPTACEAEGISWNTAKDLVKRGRAGQQPYDAFVEAWQTAKARWKSNAEARINASGDWKADAWMLERRCKEYSAPRHRVELTGKDGAPVEVAPVLSRRDAALKLRELVEAGDPEAIRLLADATSLAVEEDS